MCVALNDKMCLYVQSKFIARMYVSFGLFVYWQINFPSVVIDSILLQYGTFSGDLKYLLLLKCLST